MEEWTRWEPKQNIIERYYIDFFGMVGENWDFVIKLHNDEQKIEIRFDGMVASYKYTNESFCFRIFGELSEKYGGDFYSNWSFFKINNSEYIKWIIEKSYDSEEFMHFCIVGGDEVIDIIANHEPTVTTINSESAIKTGHD